MRDEALVSCRGVGRVLTAGRRRIEALRGVDLDVAAGESVAVVGRSGSGKSTLVGVLAALDRPHTGRVTVGGVDVWAVSERERRAVRRRFGWIPQDALSSFDPRYTAGEVVAEAVGDRGTDVFELFARVGLDPGMAGRRPVTLSGGERQRVAIARALATDPDVLLADEPTSGLDVLAQERVLDVLAVERGHRALVLVTHDLRVALRLADRVVALEEGRVVADVPVGGLAGAAPELTRLLEATPGLDH
ncbi:ABC transporter ATP-binding protein [Marinactinospora thermotolerans]|uniref:ABC-type dipeptide/oligopeptide/nickel transport system, ATPase component n=1 Tax=Marinactinospora thermotolerans DSM 45154 TaxID=1122192 RepID=A0A1T4N457_9ACTN|nr:dipeptide/oligopeptide/nickel ABC transporter ATP-binding protein [Marinactinospora thermotolerans]SJZ73891.1 ABC-type dipeptide/oligopeptide/nickel transport system, ATPase component [Marinactinospora thermotolerans DSM 45154]